MVHTDVHLYSVFVGPTYPGDNYEHPSFVSYIIFLNMV